MTVSFQTSEATKAFRDISIGRKNVADVANELRKILDEKVELVWQGDALPIIGKEAVIKTLSERKFERYTLAEEPRFAKIVNEKNKNCIQIQQEAEELSKETDRRVRINEHITIEEEHHDRIKKLTIVFVASVIKKEPQHIVHLLNFNIAVPVNELPKFGSGSLRNFRTSSHPKPL